MNVRTAYTISKLAKVISEMKVTVLHILELFCGFLPFMMKFMICLNLVVLLLFRHTEVRCCEIVLELERLA